MPPILRHIGTAPVGWASSRTRDTEPNMSLSTNSARRPHERRTFSRRDVDLRAVARFKDGRSVSCRVTNVSPMGALIEFPDDQPQPQTFRLTVPDELFAADCERRHQTGSSVGVLFMTGRAEALARFA